MRLVLPAPVLDQLDPVEVAPGVRLRVGGAEPLPFDRDTWYARVAGTAIESIESCQTEAGWPICLVRVAKPAALIGFFELFDRGVVVVATADDARTLDAHLARVRELLLAGDIDRTQREIVALAQIWSDA
jgi:hypothetical protein